MVYWRMRGGDPALLAVLPDHVHGLPSDLIVPVDGAQVTASSLSIGLLA